MNKLICVECGHIFDEEDIATWKESRGEYWGEPCYEEVSGCPRCKGDYTKAIQCDCCNEWIKGDYITTEDDRRYCEDCYRPRSLGDEQ